jgi:hypothetical protein
MEKLVVGRDCGSCTACCKELTIKHAELKKFAGELCQHCAVGQGCRIYETRPEVCRTWHCLWRSMSHLDDSWRPDRIGIILSAESVPAGHSETVGIKFSVTGAPGVLRSEKVVSVICAAVENEIPTFISAAGKIGMAGGKGLINGDLTLRNAIKERNLKNATASIWNCYKAAKAVPQVPVNLDD